MVNGSRFDEPERARLAAFVAGLGQRKAAVQLNMARNTLARLLCGQPVNRGTVVAARLAMDVVAVAQRGDKS
jgi:predicted DNA-binding protein (UPF0251 family)